MADAPGTVLLDVDGTLVDTNWIHTLAWARALRRHDHVVAMYRIHRLVGMGADRLIDELLGHDVPGIGDTHHEEYEALRPEVRLLPGAVDLVRAVHGAGLRVVLASSAREDELAFVRGLLDVDDLLDAATSADDAEVSKPAPDIFRAGLDRVGGTPGRAVVVGDTVWDMHAATDAGMTGIGVLTGGARGEELVAAGAAEVYEDAAALAAALDESVFGSLLPG